MLLEKKEDGSAIEAIFESNNILKSIYSPDRKLLYLIFQNGVAYSYYPIPSDLYNDFESNISQGKIFHERIKKDKAITVNKGFKMEEQELKDLKQKITDHIITKTMF